MLAPGPGPSSAGTPSRRGTAAGTTAGISPARATDRYQGDLLCAPLHLVVPPHVLMAGCAAEQAMQWAARLARNRKHRQQPGPVPSMDQAQPADLPHAASAPHKTAFKLSGTPVSAPASIVPQRQAEASPYPPSPATPYVQNPTPAAARPTSRSTSAPALPRQPLHPLIVQQNGPPASSQPPAPSPGTGRAAPRSPTCWHPVRAPPQVPQLSATFQAHVQRVLSRAQPALGPSPPTGCLSAEAGKQPLGAEECLPGQQQPQQEPLLAAAVCAGDVQQAWGPSEPDQRLASSMRVEETSSERQVILLHTAQVLARSSKQVHDWCAHTKEVCQASSASADPAHCMAHLTHIAICQSALR